MEIAVGDLNASIDAAERPESTFLLDHDTKGLSGSPDIVSSILKKIEGASVFVADVTPIGVVTSGTTKRHVQNPNVLIELGYAKKALGLDRVIQVWNTAITGCTVDDLPFDMRGRRGPISFHLTAGASKEEYRDTRNKLSKTLSEALGLIAPKDHTEDLWPTWRDANPKNPAIWFDEGELLPVNEPGHGAGHKSFPTAPTRYVRILPNAWERPEEIEHSSLLGHVSGISWGRTTGGFLTYQGSIVRPELADSPNGTMLFFETGEVWAIDRMIVGEYRGKRMIEGDDMFRGMASFLTRQLSKMTGTGAKPPLKVRLGVAGLQGSHWPVQNPFYGEPQAVEERVEVEGVINAPTEEALKALVAKFWADVRDAYGMPPPDAVLIDRAMQSANR